MVKSSVCYSRLAASTAMNTLLIQVMKGLRATAEDCDPSGNEEPERAVALVVACGWACSWDVLCVLYVIHVCVVQLECRNVR